MSAILRDRIHAYTLFPREVRREWDLLAWKRRNHLHFFPPFLPLVLCHQIWKKSNVNNNSWGCRLVFKNRSWTHIYSRPGMASDPWLSLCGFWGSYHFEMTKNLCTSWDRQRLPSADVFPASQPTPYVGHRNHWQAALFFSLCRKNVRNYISNSGTREQTAPYFLFNYKRLNAFVASKTWCTVFFERFPSRESHLSWLNVDLFPASDQGDIRGPERMPRHRDRIKGCAWLMRDLSVVLHCSGRPSTVWKAFSLHTFLVF